MSHLFLTSQSYGRVYITEFFFCFHRTCKENPEEKIAALVTEMSEEFCRLYTQSTEDYNGPSMDFAKMRLQMGQILYYTFLEHILIDEKRRGVDLMVVFRDLCMHSANPVQCMQHFFDC